MHRADRLDRAARPARPAADRRPRPAPRSPVASRRGSAPPSPRRSTTALSYPHVGFTGLVHIRIPTFMALIEDLRGRPGVDRLPADRVPQRPLRQHLRDRLRLRERGAAAARRRARLPDQLLGRHDRRGGRRVLRPDRPASTPTKAETSAVMAIDPALVDLDAANAEMPPFPEVTNPAAGPHGVLLLGPGLRPPGDAVRHVGRRPRVDGRVRRALPRGRDRGDDPDARRHRADVRGDAAALRPGQAASAANQVPARITRRTPSPASSSTSRPADRRRSGRGR